MKTVTIGILAHVDAGKTTLTEALMYDSGMLKKMGRVDRKDAYLDTHALEKERGITIFSKQAVIYPGRANGAGDVDTARDSRSAEIQCSTDVRYVIVDTPGHVDFAPEMERVLPVLDYCVVVISAADGIQGHTRTLKRLLDEYGVPFFIFVNKMDREGADREKLTDELVREFGDGCVDIGDVTEKFEGEIAEEIAMLDEDVMESYLETGRIAVSDVKKLISDRKMHPIFFGSALKMDGISGFYKSLITLTKPCMAKDPTGSEDKYIKDKNKINSEGGDKNISNSYDESNFGAIIFKISRDENGERLTHLRVTSGSLTPKQPIKTGDEVEKADQLRLYTGDGYELMDEAAAGDICAVTGLRHTFPGQGLGIEDDLEPPVIEPVMSYALRLEDGVSEVAFLPKLRILEEEMPELNVSLNKETPQIIVTVMGKVQTEILKNVIAERYGVDVDFEEAGIVYRETLTKPVIGIGHYEPLRHYAEVHIAIEPLPAGSGIVVDTDVSEDELSLNWQRLICTHILEREHPGVLIGASLTDARLTVIGGRAHQKHTEGGDFRQATYRAIRQGLMQAECRILEPYYRYFLTVPKGQMGRVMTDIERMGGSFFLEDDKVHTRDGFSAISGMAPVFHMSAYPSEIASISGGEGEISLEFLGYFPAHNEEEIIKKYAYDPLKDEENPTGSVFCANGAGHYVPWDEVSEHAHIKIDKRLVRKTDDEDEENHTLIRMDEALGVDEIDEILLGAYGKNKRTDKNSRRRALEKTVRRAERPVGEAKPKKKKKSGSYLLVDGYNVIHAFKELKELSEVDMEQARGRLQDILCNYQGYMGGDVILVYDAYRVAGHDTEIFDYHGIHVVYTKTAETADQYIERFSVEKADRYNITVVTSDGLEQIIIRGAGAHLMSARDFEEEVERVGRKVREFMDE